MLKGRPVPVERAQIDTYLSIARERRRRLERDVVLTVVGAILGTMIGLIHQLVMQIGCYHVTAKVMPMRPGKACRASGRGYSVLIVVPASKIVLRPGMSASIPAPTDA